jgi:hypothetical protein
VPHDVPGSLFQTSAEIKHSDPPLLAVIALRSNVLL